MSRANPLWGSPRIHGERLKIGIDVGQTSVAKYMARFRRPPSQGWKTFLQNHVYGIASIDLSGVPTVTFRKLYGLPNLGHGRRRIMGLNMTAHPTAEWVARRLTEACGWDQPSEYQIRDNNGIFGAIFKHRIRAMGIRDRPMAPRSPWQNGYAERLSVLSDGNALTASSCLANDFCVICSIPTRNITIMPARTYPEPRHAHFPHC